MTFRHAGPRDNTNACLRLATARHVLNVLDDRLGVSVGLAYLLPADEERWSAYLTDDEPPEVAFSCPQYAEREFK